MRKNYSENFKTSIAVAMIREQETVAELAKKYELHCSLLTRWKKEALEGLPEIFSTKRKKTKNDDENLINELYKQIGQLKVENDWLKKRLIQSVSDRRPLIDKNNERLSINRQCDLLEVSKGALYYEPRPIDPYTLLLMDLMDKQHTKTPFYGSRRLAVYLKSVGHRVNRKRVQRLMREMRIEAIYPKPKLSRRNENHKIYPYLLKGLKIKRARSSMEYRYYTY